MWPAQPKVNGVPKKRQVFGRYRHGQSNRQIHFAALGDAALAQRPQIRSAQELLGLSLRAIELQIKLESAVAKRAPELARKGLVARDANAVCVQQHIVDARMVLQPSQQFKKLRVQRRFAAGQLENLNASFAVDHTLNAPFKILEGHRVDAPAGADGRIRVAGRTGQIAGTDNLDQGEASGQRLHGAIGRAAGVSTQRPGADAVGIKSSAGLSVTAGILRAASGQPVKTRVRSDADSCFTMLGTVPLQENFCRHGAGAPDLGGTGCVTDRATAGCALEELVANYVAERRKFWERGHFR